MLFLLFLLTGLFFKKNEEQYIEQYREIVAAAQKKFKEVKHCYDDTKKDKDSYEEVEYESLLWKLSVIKDLVNKKNRQYRHFILELVQI